MKRNRSMLINPGVLLVLGMFATATLANAAGKPGKPLKRGQHKTVELTNVQQKPLTNIAIKFSGNDPGDFSQTNNCPPELAKGKNCIIDITFLPKTPGSKSASMEVLTSGGGQTVALTGTAM